MVIAPARRPVPTGRDIINQAIASESGDPKLAIKKFRQADKLDPNKIDLAALGVEINNQ